ncbi:MAG: response regulator [Bacteroidia bacterium]
MNPKTKLVIADDHHIFRMGLITSLEPFEHIQILADFSSGEDLLNWFNRNPDNLPDVVMVDMKMSGMDGVEVTKNIKVKYPLIRVIGLSFYESHFHVVNMFKAGASAYLLKDTLPEEIAEAISTVMEKEYYFNQNISVKLLKSIIDKETLKANKGQGGEDLSEQEAELLKLICEEHTNTEIAEKLNLGTKTVENYRNKLLTKTGAKNTAGLVMYAIRKGYIVV